MPTTTVNDSEKGPLEPSSSVKDFSTLNTFQISTDLKLIRVELLLDEKLDRIELVRKPKTTQRNTHKTFSRKNSYDKKETSKAIPIFKEWNTENK